VANAGPEHNPPRPDKDVEEFLHWVRAFTPDRQERIVRTLQAELAAFRGTAVTTGEQLEARPPSVESMTAAATRMPPEDRLQLQDVLEALNGRPAAGCWSRLRTVNEWAPIFHVHRNIMGEYLNTGAVRCQKLGGRWRIDIRDLPAPEECPGEEESPGE
jgi:hypothetical protein